MFVEGKIEQRGNQKVVVHGNDSQLVAEFRKVQELQAHATEMSAYTENPQVIYKEVIKIRICVPGDAKTVIDRPIKEHSDSSGPSDALRFPEQWARFKAGEKQLSEGHALIEMGLGETEIKNLEFYNIKTVEHLINVPDGLYSDIGMGTRAIVKSAKEWLDHKNSAKELMKEQEERIKLLESKESQYAAQDDRIKFLEDQIAMLAKFKQEMLDQNNMNPILLLPEAHIGDEITIKNETEKPVIVIDKKPTKHSSST